MKRLPDESFEEYRIRRLESNRAVRKRKGRIVWHGKIGGPLCYPWSVTEKTNGECRENAGLLFEQMKRRGMI